MDKIKQTITSLFLALNLASCADLRPPKDFDTTPLDVADSLEELVSYRIVPEHIDTLIRLIKINPTIKREDGNALVFEKYLLIQNHTQNLLIGIVYSDFGKNGADDRINNYDNLRIFEILMKKSSKQYKGDIVSFDEIKKDIITRYPFFTCVYDQNIMGNLRNCNDGAPNYNEGDKLVKHITHLIEKGPYTRVRFLTH